MSTARTSHESTLRHDPTSRRINVDIPAGQSFSLGIVGLLEFPGLHHQRAIELRTTISRSTYDVPVNRAMAFCRTDQPQVSCPNDFAPGIHSLGLNAASVTQYDAGLSAHVRVAFARGDVRPFLGLGVAGSLPLGASSDGSFSLVHRSLDLEFISEAKSEQEVGLIRRPSFGPGILVGLNTPRFQVDLSGSAQAYAFDPDRLVFVIEGGVVYFFRTR